ncbi:hypothetical protein ACFTZI_01800 [Streptomyces decoyicus]|uniref:hypothetical protein n=1 Tax=Streptomyces decoyicus TaxID=249567 RepID=UPI0036408992
MDSEARTFPPHPIRGVQAVYARQSSCPADFALVTVDFEPWEEGITFQVATDLDIPECDRSAFSQSDIAAFQTALDMGIREELTEQGIGATVAVSVVLRSMRLHIVDSHPDAFQAVGHVAVRNALALAYGPSPGPRRRRT